MQHAIQGEERLREGKAGSILSVFAQRQNYCVIIFEVILSTTVTNRHRHTIRLIVVHVHIFLVESCAFCEYKNSIVAWMEKSSKNFADKLRSIQCATYILKGAFTVLNHGFPTAPLNCNPFYSCVIVPLKFWGAAACVPGSLPYFILILRSLFTV